MTVVHAKHHPDEHSIVSRSVLCRALCAIVVLSACCLSVTAQAPPPASAAKGPASPPQVRVRSETPAVQSSVGVDGSEAMFTTMCALLAAGYEADVSADHWSAYRSQMRQRLQEQQGPAVEALRQFYREHQLSDPGAMLSR